MNEKGKKEREERGWGWVSMWEGAPKLLCKSESTIIFSLSNWSNSPKSLNIFPNKQTISFFFFLHDIICFPPFFHIIIKLNQQKSHM